MHSAAPLTIFNLFLQSESSQLDAKVSGVEVNAIGKRESLLSKADKLEEKTPLQATVKVS